MHANDRNLENIKMYGKAGRITPPQEILITILDFFLQLFSVCIEQILKTHHIVVLLYNCIVGIFPCR